MTFTPPPRDQGTPINSPPYSVWKSVAWAMILMLCMVMTVVWGLVGFVALVYWASLLVTASQIRTIRTKWPHI